jgi:hypothetical protein
MHDSFNPPTISFFFQKRHQTNCNKTPLLLTMTSHRRPIHCKHFSKNKMSRDRTRDTHKREWKTTNNNKIKIYCPQDKTHRGLGDIYTETSIFRFGKRLGHVNRPRNGEGRGLRKRVIGEICWPSEQGRSKKKGCWASCDYKL